MTEVAEIHALDDDFAVQRVARLIVVAGGIEILALQSDGASLARSMMEDPLYDPYGELVEPADGAAFLRTLRWCCSGERLWITPVSELPEELAREPDVPLRSRSVRHVPATLPYPKVPRALHAIRVVELVRPDPEDYFDRDVLARIVAAPGAPPRLEGGRPGTERALQALIDAAEPPVHERDYTELAPGIRAFHLRFDQPGRAAWRHALVRAHRAARAAADGPAIARLDLELSTLLPRIWLSRCPFRGHVLRVALDAWGFDSPFWDAAAPVRPCDEEPPPSFLGLAGSVRNATPDVPAEAAGAGRPPVFPALLADPRRARDPVRRRHRRPPVRPRRLLPSLLVTRSDRRSRMGNPPRAHRDLARLAVDHRAGSGPARRPRPDALAPLRPAAMDRAARHRRHPAHRHRRLPLARLIPRYARFGGIGTNRDTRRWYSAYASPLLRSACASVGGMPVTPKIEPRMIACGTRAMSPHGA